MVLSEQPIIINRKLIYQCTVGEVFWQFNSQI